jgi:hypothetical protein
MRLISTIEPRAPCTEDRALRVCCQPTFAFQVLDLHGRLLWGLDKTTCFASSLVYPGNMETKKCPVLVVDRPCGLELFHVSTEEPTSDSPPLELWECAKGHRMHLASKKEESKSEAEN